jgi:aerobic carbon-monoxide dehydrogenase medium subunit
VYPSEIEGYVAPCTVQEATEAFAKWGEETHYIAGGQSLMQAVKSRMIRPRCLVDLQKIVSIRGLHEDGSGRRIGAMTRYCDIASSRRLGGAFAALVDAASHVGDRQVRHRGTIGGSLCWNYISACMPVTNLAIGSQMSLVSLSGATRELGVDAFLGAPMETSRNEGEILLSIKLPQPAGRAGSAYRKWSLLTDGLPMIGVAAFLVLDETDRCALARIAVTGLESGPTRVPAAERALLGLAGSDRAKIETLLKDSASSLQMHSDEAGDAEYRKVLFRQLSLEVVTMAFDRAFGGKE